MWIFVQTPNIKTGITYCIVTQAAHQWLGTLLVARGKVVGLGQRLAPPDQLRREEAARTLGELFIDWTERTELDGDGRALFEAARRQLLSAVAQAPPRELPGCAKCPARCQMLPFVGPLDLPKLANQLTGMLTTGNTPTPERIVNLWQRLGPIERSVPLLSRHGDNPLIRRNWLYCLLTNLELAPAAAPGRDELLEALRQLPVATEAEEMLGIFGGGI